MPDLLTNFDYPTIIVIELCFTEFDHISGTVTAQAPCYVTSNRGQK